MGKMVARRALMHKWADGISSLAPTKGSVANFRVKRDDASAEHNYPANSANCSKPGFPRRSNCPLRIICATSMPARVAAAELNDLTVCMGRVIFFMKR